MCALPPLFPPSTTVVPFRFALPALPPFSAALVPRDRAVHGNSRVCISRRRHRLVRPGVTASWPILVRESFRFHHPLGPWLHIVPRINPSEYLPDSWQRVIFARDALGELFCENDSYLRVSIDPRTLSPPKEAEIDMARVLSQTRPRVRCCVTLQQ